MANQGRIRGIGAHVFLLGLLMLTHDALAQSGKQLLLRAKDNYKLGNYEKSIEELNRVVAGPSKKAVVGEAHLYLALNHALLGNLNKTRNHFRKALKYSPLLTVDPRRVRPKTYSLFQRIRKSFAGVIEVAADKPGARVYIDRKMMGTVPYQGKISIGRHRLRVVSVDGKEEYFDEKLLIGARESRAVMAKLRKKLKKKPNKKLMKKPVNRLLNFLAPPKIRRKSRSIFRKWWFWTIIGVALAGGSIGLYYLLNKKSPEEIPVD